MVTPRSLRLFHAGIAVCVVAFGGLWAGRALGQEGGPPAASAEVEAGRALYELRCRVCHGAEGRGDGPAAEFLRPRPRDFTLGLYKIRSTPSGQLPRDEDLVRTVRQGLFGTGMPGWETVLHEKEQAHTVQFIKTFSKRFGRQKAPLTVVTPGKPVASSAESIAKGKQLFRDIECWKCHGEEGRADGPSAPELQDDLGFPIRPANLTKPWNFRGGSAPKDIYLRITTGLNGTPMPSFADVLDNEKTWHLVNYVLSLSPKKKPDLGLVVRARRIGEAVPAQPDDARWDAVEASRFPLVGQVIRDPRMFTPSVTDIAVKAVYNDKEIALRLAWDDPTMSRPRPAAEERVPPEGVESLSAPTGSRQPEGSATEVFEDVVAVQFPVHKIAGLKKPYFLMGTPGHPVNLWRWGTGTEQVVERNATGIDQVTASPGRTVTSSAVFQHGQHRVVMRRPLTTSDAEHDVQLEPGRFTPIAFFVWDGSNGETGTKMAISHWYYLLLDPPTPRAVYVAPPLAVLIAAGVEWWVVRRLRRRKEEQS